MSQHTPEPWIWSVPPKDNRIPGEYRFTLQSHHHGKCTQILSHHANWQVDPQDMERLTACVNGCAGLNPAAYRACVEALESARIFLPSDSDVLRQADEALALAEGANK